MLQIHPDKNVHFLSVRFSFYHVLGERAIISGRNRNCGSSSHGAGFWCMKAGILRLSQRSARSHHVAAAAAKRMGEHLAPDKKMPWILCRMHGRSAMKQDGPYGSFFRARSLVYRARVALSTASTITPTSAKMAVHMLAMPTAPSTRQANLMASANTMF